MAKTKTTVTKKPATTRKSSTKKATVSKEETIMKDLSNYVPTTEEIPETTSTISKSIVNVVDWTAIESDKKLIYKYVVADNGVFTQMKRTNKFVLDQVLEDVVRECVCFTTTGLRLNIKSTDKKWIHNPRVTADDMVHIDAITKEFVDKYLILNESGKSYRMNAMIFAWCSYNRNAGLPMYVFTKSNGEKVYYLVDYSKKAIIVSDKNGAVSDKSFALDKESGKKLTTTCKFYKFFIAESPKAEEPKKDEPEKNPDIKSFGKVDLFNLFKDGELRKDLSKTEIDKAIMYLNYLKK